MDTKFNSFAEYASLLSLYTCWVCGS